MKILTVMPVSEENMELIKSAAPEADFVFCQNPHDKTIEDADVIIGNVPADELKNNSKLKFLQTNSAGVDDYVKPGVLPEGCVLANATGGYGLAVSEHMLAMYLEIIKKLHLYRDMQNNSLWKDQGTVTTVKGATVLVLGLGDIGTGFAGYCKALGAYVIGVRRRDMRPSDSAHEIHTIDDLDELLPRADCVAIALPGTAETKDLINRERLARMKKGAVLINAGRGTVVDTEALCDALESGHLGGAGLDVTDPEPLPPESRLWKIPTAVITPHVSGGYHLKETHERIISIAAENLEAFVKGKKIKNIVDFETGYRKL